MFSNSPTIGQHFAFAAGRTGVLQQLLLSKTDVDRMLGSKDRKEVEAILTEVKLTSMIDQGLSTSSEILEAIAGWIYKEVVDMTPENKQPTFHILWLAQQSPRLSFLLKKRHPLTVAQNNETVEVGGTMGLDICSSYMENGGTSPLPSHMKEFLNEAMSWDHPSPIFIDNEVAKFIAKTQCMLATKSGSSHIKRYVSHSIDLQNIRMALRSCEKEELESALLPGGTIALSNFTKGTPVLLAHLNTSSLGYDISDAILEAGKDPILLERACSDVLAEDIASMWNVPMSIEPVFAFAAIALSNLFLIRSILIGKGNDLSPQDIKAILPPFIPASHYVTS